MLRTLKSPVLHALLFAAFIFALSSMPSPPVLGPLPLNDKVKHVALYGVFAVLVWRALRGAVHPPWAVGALTVLLVSSYGATDEYHQRFTPGRSCDVHDWQADTLAALVVAASLAANQRRKNE
jgi:VanZ family protein